MRCPRKYTQTLRQRRRQRIRAKVRGSAQRPRLSVFKSSCHVYAQIIDDEQGRTLAFIHSYGGKQESPRAGLETCNKLGTELASRCKSAGIDKVVFDRGGFPYHGRVQAFAEGARAGGLVF